MAEPIAVDAGNFFEFIGGPGLKTIFVSLHPVHSFSQALGQQLSADHDTIALGTIGLYDLVARGGPALPFLYQGLRACGAPVSFGVLPGYCMFKGTEMVAWDAGLPAVGDVQGIFRSTLAGMIWSGLTNDVSFVSQALRMATEQVAAQRVAVRFKVAAADRGANRWSTPQSAPVDDVYWAYQMLGVLPTATDREVHDAWRKRRMENHPDHAGSDRADFDLRSRISAEINRARDIIINHRKSAA